MNAIRLVVHIDVAKINTLLSSAGIGYWGRWVTDESGMDCVEAEDNPGVLEELNIDMGIETAINKGLGRIFNNNTDANDGDIFVQLCAFGEVRYG